MRRREFMTLLGGAAVAPLILWPLAARAQQPGGMPHLIYSTIGFRPLPENDPGERAQRSAFREALEKLGWADGRNIRIDYRTDAIDPEDRERMRAAAAEFVSLAPNVILTAGSPMAAALRLATRTIPIVFVGAVDPLSSGLVESMAHPGGNLTGFAIYEFSFGGKWLQMLKEVAPGTRRVLVFLAPGNIGSQGLMRAIEAAAPTLGVQTVAVPVAIRGALAFERAIDAFAREPNGGLLALPGSLDGELEDLMIELAARHRLPAMYTYRPLTASGGLMSYSTDGVDLRRRAASYVDRILRGEKPGDLPVQLPTKFDLVINMKTAKALGLTVPLALLASADEVIE